MGQLKSRFVPLVFAELYKLLASEKSYATALEDHLDFVHLPLEWLDEASEAYETKWKSDLGFVTPDSIQDVALSDQHTEFATWLLSGLRLIKSCGELSEKLETAILERALNEIEGMLLPLPPALSPTIIGWTLGSVIGRGGNDLPVVPAIWPQDANVRLAFEGLIEHVLALQEMQEPWPEMMQTAMYWRGSGLAEALRPEAGRGGLALERLRIGALSTMAEAQRHEVGRHLDDFNDRRNALSHITDDRSRLSFVDVIGELQPASSVSLTMRAMTQFVFHDLSASVREKRPKVVRQGAWESMKQEVEVWD
ncbi:hypothetical protein [Paenarthrobacter sp. NPDC090522]|uniref:hypothetical protein n=1 Tax=Paenarthrobacter sp. NPDC090522 TaxID=3364383 RepID=UPI003827A28B